MNFAAFFILIQNAMRSFVQLLLTYIIASIALLQLPATGMASVWAGSTFVTEDVVSGKLIEDPVDVSIELSSAEELVNDELARINRRASFQQLHTGLLTGLWQNCTQLFYTFLSKATFDPPVAQPVKSCCYGYLFLLYLF